MKIDLKEITISELAEGYKDNAEDGVVGYGGKLDIRPAYQREFIYNYKQRNAVIETVMKNFPLNVMYWVKRVDGMYEVMDGQQRTISICKYIAREFSINYKYFDNLTEEEKDQIRNYKLMVYFCEGTDREKLDWFETINIAGEKLTAQEIRNAIYAGTWLTDAKKKFSKRGCPAFGIASKYLKGSSIRQDYLETAIRWISHDNIEQYMAEHQHDPNANELWLYFKNVIEWVELTFTTYRHEMKGIGWGSIYDQYKGNMFDTAKLEQETQALMIDDDIPKKSGIYPYLLTHNEKYLNIRLFTESQKRAAYEKQNGICAKCGELFGIEEMEADHITPWREGGKTINENCQMLCKRDNREKSDK